MEKSWADLLMDDHQTAERVFEAVERSLANPTGPNTRLLALFMEFAAGYVDAVHSQKEERHLFPLVERRGIPRDGGPLAVMLSEHESSRAMLAPLRDAVGRVLRGDSAALDDLRRTFSQYAETMRGHFWKENDILFPMARRVLSEEDARAVVAGIEAEEARHGTNTREKYYTLANEIEFLGGVRDLAHELPVETLAALLNTLPVEISFVDDQDRVRYFSHENRPKIFPRTRGAIGMAVQNCHPEKSLHLVNQILADFRAGRREVAEFWIDMAGKKVHIRYFPVRDPDGTYLGTMEVVQDIGPLRDLEGERRLLVEERGGPH